MPGPVLDVASAVRRSLRWADLGISSLLVVAPAARPLLLDRLGADRGVDLVVELSSVVGLVDEVLDRLGVGERDGLAWGPDAAPSAWHVLRLAEALRLAEVDVVVVEVTDTRAAQLLLGAWRDELIEGGANWIVVADPPTAEALRNGPADGLLLSRARVHTTAA